MVNLSGLSVAVRASVADFNAGMERAQEKAQDLSVSLFRLGRASNEAEGEIDSVGRSALSTAGYIGAMDGAASGGVGAVLGLGESSGSSSGLVSLLSQSVKGLTTSLVGLVGTLTIATGALGVFGALLSTLVPLAAVLGTVTAGMGALAGAFGAVIGTGILAFGKKRGAQNKERLKQLRNKIAANKTQVEQIEAQINSLEELRKANEGLTASQQKQLQELIARKNELEQTIDKQEETAKKVEKTTGIMGGLKDALADLKEELVPIITDFGEEFIPLIERVLDVLPDAVEIFLDAAPSMASFSDTLHDMGENLMRILPRLSDMFWDLSLRALSAFIDVLDWIGANGMDVLRGMWRTTQRLAPTFRDLIGAFINAIPAINRFGTKVLQVVVPALTNAFDAIQDLANFAKGTGGLVGFLKKLLSTAAGWISGPGKKKIVTAANALLDRFSNALSPTKKEGGGIIPAFVDRLKSVLEGVANWLTKKGGEAKISNMLSSLMGGIATQLKQVSESDIQKIISNLQTILASVFSAVATALQSEQAKGMSKQLGRIAGTTLRELADRLIKYAKSDQFKKDLQGLTGAIANTVGVAIKEGFIQAFGATGLRSNEQFRENLNEALSKPLPPSPISAEEFNKNLEESLSQPLPQFLMGGQQPSDQNFSQTIQVEVKGDTGVVESVAVNAADKQIEQQARGAARNTATNTAPR